MGYMENYEEWLANPYFDEDTKKELESIRGEKTRSRNVFMRILNLVQRDFAGYRSRYQPYECIHRT